MRFPLNPLAIIYKLFSPKVQVLKGSDIDKYSKIGDYTYIGKNCTVTKATIGRYVSIANNVSIGPGEHDISEISTNSIFYDNAYEQLTQKEVELGNDVWIAANTIVRRGVKIGNGAVIGANSFVNTDVPPYAVFAGTPAKLIKYRFSEEKIAKIEASLWWLNSPAEAKVLFQQITSREKRLGSF